VSNERDVVAHLADCFDATYLALGELAPLMSDDSYVVCAHEMSRCFGQVALDLRNYTHESPSPLAIVYDVLCRSWSLDSSGALTLYALAIVVGPRLLVSLRDALEVVSDGVVRGLFNEAQAVTVRQVRRVGDLAESTAPLEGERWQIGARELVEMTDLSGNADSFGISR
jgi:hypothetical protein